MTIEVLAATAEGESGRIRLELRLADGSRPVRFLAERAIARDFHDPLAAALGVR